MLQGLYYDLDDNQSYIYNFEKIFMLEDNLV